MKSTWKVEEGGAIGRYLEHHRGHEISHTHHQGIGLVALVSESLPVRNVTVCVGVLHLI